MNKIVFHAENGDEYDEVPVGGGGRCGVLVLIAQKMLKEGTPVAVVREAVHGDLAADVTTCLQDLRLQIVEKSKGHPLCSASIDAYTGPKEPPLKEVLKNPRYAIRGRERWEQVMSHSSGWVDGMFILLGAEELELDFEIVIADKDGKLVPLHSQGSSVTCRHLALWDQYGHFTALVRKVRLSESCALEGGLIRVV